MVKDNGGDKQRQRNDVGSKEAQNRGGAKFTNERVAATTKTKTNETNNVRQNNKQ